MNCDGVRGLLSAYVDGELSAGELLRVEQHLRRCHWCADEVDALRQTISLVASLDEVALPPAFHAQLHQRLVAMAPPVMTARRPAFRRWTVPAAAAAALVIGVAGLNQFNLLAPQPPVAQVGTVEGNSQLAMNPTHVENPVTAQEPGDTDAEPNSQQGGTSKENDQTAITPPIVVEPPVENGGEGRSTTPLGPTSNEPGIQTASFVADIAEPASYKSARQPGAQVEAAVAEPASLALALRNHFGEAASESVDPATGTIRLQVSLPASDFATGLAFVEGQTGQKGTDTSVALDLAQLDKIYEELMTLEQKRQDAEARKAGLTDQASITLAEQELKQLEQKAAEAQENYRKLVDLSATGTIDVTLKPLTAR